jgi:hypothetical protein
MCMMPHLFQAANNAGTLMALGCGRARRRTTEWRSPPWWRWLSHASPGVETAWQSASVPGSVLHLQVLFSTQCAPNIMARRMACLTAQRDHFVNVARRRQAYTRPLFSRLAVLVASPTRVLGSDWGQLCTHVQNQNKCATLSRKDDECKP